MDFESEKYVVFSTGKTLITENWLIPIFFFLSFIVLIGMNLTAFGLFGDKVDQNEF